MATKKVKKPSSTIPALSLSRLKINTKEKKEKRVGRGRGSGMGKTATRGHKGQRARSGHKIKAFFEGGQMPLHLRIPKTRGFKSLHPSPYQTVNFYQIAKKNLLLVTNETLLAANLIDRLTKPVKILATGELTSAITFQVAAYSQQARKKILAAKGKIKAISDD